MTRAQDLREKLDLRQYSTIRNPSHETREDEEIIGDAEREWREALAQEIEAEAQLVPVGEEFRGGHLHGASVFNVMMWAVRRIREEKP